MKQHLQQGLIDRIQFGLDVFPGLRYQPLPWLGLSRANRGAGTLQRWEAIRPVLLDTKCRTAVDIGCNVGFFCFAMHEIGIATVGVEISEQNWRIAAFARRRLKAAHVGLLSLDVAPRTIELLPGGDAVLLLSVWHHWVKNFGFDAATAMLAQIWRRTARVLFFETGEAEMSSDYALPAMLPSPREWLVSYLTSVCEGARVVHLGHTKAFAPGGSETRAVASRNLLSLLR